MTPHQHIKEIESYVLFNKANSKKYKLMLEIINELKTLIDE